MLTSSELIIGTVYVFFYILIGSHLSVYMEIGLAENCYLSGIC